MAFLAVQLPLAAQLYPQDSQVISYFPHLVDGGPSGTRWTTNLTFVNPHQTATSGAKAFFYDDNGSPLALDFGSGAATSLSFTVPPQGSVTLKSAAASATTVAGWAVVASGLPLEGVIQYTLSSGGTSQQSISVQATPPSTLFRSPATSTSGIAVANPSSSSLTVGVTAIDSGGKTVGQGSFPVPALGHHAVNLFQVVPALPSSFQGSILISSTGSEFVAVTISADGAALSNYPPSGLNWPVSLPEDLFKVWSEVADAGSSLIALNPAPTLVVDGTAGPLNAYAVAIKNEVHISASLAELISDSESESAFVMAHALGHLIQGQAGLVLVPSSAEADADQYGVFLSLIAGYDPYGGAGALGKLVMASGNASFLSPSFDNQAAGTDLKAYLTNRLGSLSQNVLGVCQSSPDLQTACAAFRAAIHPHFPGTVPLAAPPAAPIFPRKSILSLH